MERTFSRDVVDDFVAEYARGRTPIPCVRCNTFTKFRDLVAKADAVDAPWIATGHYARAGGGVMRRGRTTPRTRAISSGESSARRFRGCCLPVGEMTKAETRALARELGFNVVAEKMESQDICFVPDGDYAEIVSRRLGADAPSLSPARS